MLRFHGDAEIAPGLVDLAVNVRQETPPSWLTGPIAASLAHLARYPDPAEATAAIAARHGRPPSEVLLTAGAAQAFTLLGPALRPRRPVVVHPQFTEPEAALRTAGHDVTRAVLSEAHGFVLKNLEISPEADLLVIGNPTNPTSVLHPAEDLAALTRDGRVTVVDEAFADTVPGEPESLAGRRDLPGLLVIRSLTKTWGLAGLRIGYVLGPAELIERLREHAPLWSVSTPALAAAIACASPRAVDMEREIATRLAADRAHLVAALERAGVAVAGRPASSFVLIKVPGGESVRAALRERGFAVRRGETFPGLGPDWLRIAVRDTATSDAFVAVLSDVLGGSTC
ncbi:Rv2231c family pyridoxal phosphate-dependent protein CobC [Dactylosporangium salmoneum]|uniref:Aminotransferase n=1 Tax=Dactylosporangium salmoneum TaxID=53361 RepID=A0ABP5TJX3_9ACTN